MPVVFDLDGTTIFKGKKMTSEITQAIELLSEKHQVIFASARPIRDMLPVLPEVFHNFDLIGGNGAFTKEGETIQTSSFTDQQIAFMLDLIETRQLNYMMDSQWDYSFKGDNKHPLFLGVDPHNLANNIHPRELETIVKVVLFTTDKTVISELEEQAISVHFHGSEELIDLSPTGISKWTAFKQLGIEGNLVMFGNDTNDLPMFENANQKFVVGNLLREVDQATYVSEEDVARTILELAKQTKKVLI